MFFIFIIFEPLIVLLIVLKFPNAESDKFEKAVPKLLWDFSKL